MAYRELQSTIDYSIASRLRRAVQSPQAATILVFAIVVAAWSANWPVMKLAITHIDPTWLSAMRFIITVTVLGLLTVALGRFRFPRKNEVVLLVSVATLQMAAFTIFSANALRFMPAGSASVIAYSTPLWVAPAAALFLKEHLSMRGAIGSVLGVLGIGALASPAFFESSPGIIYGVAMLAAASLCWSVVIVIARRAKPATDGMLLVTWQAILASVLVTPIAFLLDGAPDFSGTFEGYLSVGFVGVFATAIPFLGTLWLASRVTALAMSVGMLAVPFCSIILSYALLSETLDLATAVGLVLIAIGVSITLLKRQTSNRDGG